MNNTISSSHQSSLEDRLQLATDIAEHAPMGILNCNVEGNIIFLNSMVAKLLGSPNVEETKKINLFTFPLLVNSGFSEKLKRSFETNNHINYESNYESKWGRRIWLNIHIKPFLSGGEKLAMVIIDDFTERKNIEDQLTSLSFTDTLTGAYNRRYFKQKAEEEILHAKKLHRSFSVILLDLDHFKSVNDTFGHDAGDVVLKALTDLIMQRIRKTDILARWGGEEFVILLTDISCQQAVNIAEKLRQDLMQTDIPPVGYITASFGIASYQDEETIDALFLRADKMMYRAKQEGRNCVRS